MWQEVLMEKPARRGVAVVTMTVLLAATSGLAWAISTSRTPPPMAAEPTSPFRWPIAFTLPEQYSWTPDSDTDLYSTLQYGNLGRAGFVGRSALRGKAALMVLFIVMDEGTTPEQAVEELFETSFINDQPIAIGPLEGRMIRLSLPRRMGTSGLSFSAVACDPSGLCIAVNYVLREESDQAEQEFLGFCRTIVLKPWWISP